MTGEATRGLIDTNIVVHLAELSAGPHHTEDPVERARRISVLQHTEATFDPLPFDAEAARTYGMVCAAVLAAARTPRRRVADLMIASIAAANRLPLYTTNPDDFVEMDQLVKVVAYRGRPAREGKPSARGKWLLLGLSVLHPPGP